MESATTGYDEGAGFRVLYEGCWGLYSTNSLNKKDLKEALEEALKISRAGSNWKKKPVRLGEVPTLTAKVINKPKKNPEEIPIEEKYALLKDMYDEVAHLQGIQSVTTGYSDSWLRQEFLSTEGTSVTQESNRILAQVNIVAREEGRVIGYRARVGGTAGYELFDVDDPRVKAVEACEGAQRVLSAKKSISGHLPVVTDPDLTGVFAHEAVGHASEADLVACGDSILAGRVGEKIGTENLSIVDDSTLPGAFGSFAYDDEGVKGSRKHLIEEGVVKGLILNRETACMFDMEANGGARSESYAVRPLVRMSNTYVEKGDYSFDELIKDISYGLYLKGTRGGEVDTAKGTFQFSAQEAILIEKGELTMNIRDVSLAGRTLDTLKKIDGIGNDFRLGDPGICGKGQLIPVGDGGPHIRIQEAVVGGGS